MSTFLNTDNTASSMFIVFYPLRGYYVETDRQAEEIPSPFAGMLPLTGTSMHGVDRAHTLAESAPRPLATTIYYLLSYDRPEGIFHMNKSAVYYIRRLV